MKNWKRILCLGLLLLLAAGFCCAEEMNYGRLLADLLDAYETPYDGMMERIDEDVAALDDPVAYMVAENWKQVYLDPDYTLLIDGKDDPAMLSIPDPAAHAFVVLGFALVDGEMADELKGRCIAAAAAAKAFPEAILVCSGGATGENNPEGHTEAGLMCQYLAEECGIEDARILTDERALSTVENAVNTYAILEARGIKTMTLVTSTYHQRRAQVVYNAVAALYREEHGYFAESIGNYCLDIESSGEPAGDARIAVHQTARILNLSEEEMKLLPQMKRK